MQLIRRLAFIGALITANPALAADRQIVKAPAGKTVDAYFQINVSGDLFLRIKTKDGSNCARFWWIKWPFGSVSQLGRLCGSVKIPIPGIFSFSVASKLRVASEGSDTLIALAADERVANTTNLEF